VFGLIISRFVDFFPVNINQTKLFSSLGCATTTKLAAAVRFACLFAVSKIHVRTRIYGRRRAEGNKLIMLIAVVLIN
jgi:hypothetical protein